MMRTVVTLVLVAAVGTTGNLVAGQASSPAKAPAAPGHTARANAEIVIQNLGYSGDLTVHPGQRVVVTNKDGFNHSLTDKVHHRFDTGTVPPNGGTRSFTAPSTPGSYPFGCNFHPQMSGTLIVKATGHRSALTAPRSATINAGGRVTLRTMLTDASTHKAIAHATVTLLKRVGTHGTFRAALTRGTGSTGATSVSVAPRGVTQYAWRYAGTSAHQAVTSGIGTVRVRQVVRASLTAGHVAVHHRVKVFGTVTPSGAGRQVILQRLTSGHWVTAARATITRQTLPDHRTTVGFVLGFTPAAAGTISLRAFRAATAANLAGVSRTLTLHAT